MKRLTALLCTTALACADETLVWKQLSPLPDPLGVAAPFAGTSGGALLVAGGANFPGKMPWEGGKKVWRDRIWILKTPGGKWREAGRLPRPLAYGVSVSHRDSVVCIGGSDEERHWADAFRLIWKNDKLITQALPALPIALASTGGAITGDTLFIAGGAEQPGEQSATNRAFALDLAAKIPAWRELPPLPGAPRILAAASARDGAFYLFGGTALTPNADGIISRVPLRETWRYRPAQGWQRLADLPKPSIAAPSPAPFVEGKFLLIGGDDGSRAGYSPLERHPGFPTQILAYEPALNRWSEAGQTPAPRATVPVVEWRGNTIIPSGEARPGVRSPEVWAFTWTNR